MGKKVNGALAQGFVYGDQLDPVAETDGAGVVVGRFGYGLVSHSPDFVVKDGAAHRVITDHLGSPRFALELGSGAVAHKISYDSWGTTVDDSAPGWEPFAFAGGIAEPMAGLARFGARDYDFAIGRWVSKDPARVRGGVNFFAYAGSDPVNQTDPTGLAVAMFTLSGVGHLVFLGAEVSFMGVLDDDGNLGFALTLNGRVGVAITAMVGLGVGTNLTADTIMDIAGPGFGANVEFGPFAAEGGVSLSIVERAREYLGSLLETLLCEGQPGGLDLNPYLQPPAPLPSMGAGLGVAVNGSWTWVLPVADLW